LPQSLLRASAICDNKNKLVATTPIATTVMVNKRLDLATMSLLRRGSTTPRFVYVGTEAIWEFGVWIVGFVMQITGKS
jgi:hypothetical protein